MAFAQSSGSMPFALVVERRVANPPGLATAPGLMAEADDASNFVPRHAGFVGFIGVNGTIHHREL